MEPISTTLAGIALVQKSVEFIKSNINTANDIKDIASAIDGMFAGEKQIQQKRFGSKSVIGQTKDVANSVIDSKLAQEQMYEMKQLINFRFGHGTWEQIVAERAKRIREEKEAIAEQKRIARRKQKEFEQILLVGGSVFVGIVIFFGVLFGVLTLG
jgi:hypothetical protein|tara:strand:+ start:147 stop:614 length:468 start_codon:yes stop_codon:yes gene_type:complete